MARRPTTATACPDGGWSRGLPARRHTVTSTTRRPSTSSKAAFLIGERWLDAPRGTFLRIAAGVTHDFENRTDQRAGLLAGHR
jgi:hypothetical protein